MGFSSKAHVTKSRSIARVVAPPAAQIFSPTGASLVVQGGQVVAGGVTVKPTGAQLVAQGGTVVYGGVNARPTGASLVIRGGQPTARNFNIPSEISGLFAHYDSRLITGLSDGASVGTWIDVGGSGFDATEASAKPTYKTNIQNGNPIVRFNHAGGTQLKATFTSLAQPFTVLLIGSFATASQSIFDSRQTIVCTVDTFGASSTKYRISSGTELAGPAITTGFHCHVVVFNGANSVYSFDGSETTGNAGTASLTDGLTLGANRAAGLSMDGDMGEVVVYSRALSSPERTNLRLYSTAQWATP